MNVINSFDGEYDFLSNFYECPILWKGNLYRNSESIYQSYKTLDNVPFDFTKTTGSQAKKISKKLNVRPDWNKIKFDLMYEICQEKFNQNTDIAQKLMNTGDAILIEGNYWGDTNQKFVQIPFNTFMYMITYKAQMKGIKVIQREESYTSKCSFMDNEEICKHEKYKGNRINRGLYKTQTGRLINADLNGALNILKKEISNAFDGYGIEVCSTPIVLTIK